MANTKPKASDKVWIHLSADGWVSIGETRTRMMVVGGYSDNLRPEVRALLDLAKAKTPTASGWLVRA
jgi:hypothetical protein